MTTGEAGTREQARGLALALSDDAEERLIQVSRFWALARPLSLPLGPPAVTAAGGALTPPWPDVLVTCGRRSALVAMAIRRSNPRPMVCVHIQPPTYPKAFDLVVAGSHDRLRGSNVLRVDTALHGVRPKTLELAAKRGDARFAGLPRPWTGVLLGGSTKRWHFQVEDSLRLADQLDALRRAVGGSLLITPSRRTPDAAIATLADRFGSDPTVFMWDGALPNPYLSILGLSDRLVVTSDSVSMTSEALATTAPVLSFRLSGSPRHARFVDNLVGKGWVGLLDGPPPEGRRLARDATLEVASAVQRIIAEKLPG